MRPTRPEDNAVEMPFSKTVIYSFLSDPTTEKLGKNFFPDFGQVHKNKYRLRKVKISVCLVMCV